jgi:hypothetical protein
MYLPGLSYSRYLGGLNVNVSAALNPLLSGKNTTLNSWLMVIRSGRMILNTHGLGAALRLP